MQHQPATWVSSVAKGKFVHDVLLLMVVGGLCVPTECWPSSKPPEAHACQQQLVELLWAVWSVHPEPAHQQLWLPCRLPI